MPDGLTMSLAPERLEEGTLEERAAFGLFMIHANGIALTEGFDYFINGLRAGPLVSGYHGAEWFAWNWWRLMFEPYRRAAPQWGLAHRLPAVGGGYTWPNIEIRSDGQRAVLLSRPSSRPDAKPFRFLGAAPWLGPLKELEAAIDSFVAQVLARVSSQLNTQTNLQGLWNELVAERRDPNIARRRRLEALMGRDPGDVPDALLDRLVTESRAIGVEALDELAANAPEGAPLAVGELREMSVASRLVSDRRDAARLPPATLSAIRRESLAWRQGKRAADELRRTEGLGSAPVKTDRLVALLGAAGDVEAAAAGRNVPLSFLMRRGGEKVGVVLRSSWPTGRRFDLARLLGDRLLFGRDAVLSPATQAYTFRQKAQRSFAAEFLSPFEAVEDALGDDFSKEGIEDVARVFDVSPLTIETLLVNHGCLDRELTADAA